MSVIVVPVAVTAARVAVVLVVQFAPIHHFPLDLLDLSSDAVCCGESQFLHAIVNARGVALQAIDELAQARLNLTINYVD